MTVALVHDYLTQRGGAERVVLAMARAFPGAPIYTSLFEPAGTFPEFRDLDVRPLALNAVGPLRRRHRAALPLLAPSFSRLRVQADAVLCSSSGWAHGAVVSGRKIVYCHTPARWLYQTDRYLGAGLDARRLALAPLRPALLRWDARAAASADRYLANSTAVAERVRETYGREAEVLPAPPSLGPAGLREPVAGIEPGFLLCVSRLLPYKNVGAVIEAAAATGERLVVVGAGPLEASLRAAAPAHVAVLGAVSDEQLRWLYAASAGVVAAGYEDYGLVPLEAAAFGKPAAALRFGGFLDTVDEGRTGIFFDRAEPASIADAVRALIAASWDASALERHADRFSEQRFAARLQAIVAGEAAMETAA